MTSRSTAADVEPVRVLLDTSVVIELVEFKSGAALCLERLQEFDPRYVHISVVTIFEVEAGLFDGSTNIRRRRERWDAIFQVAVNELVFDQVASDAARIVRETAKAGKQLGAMDALIAATAIEYRLVLATRDRDFERVDGLNVEYWR